MTVVPFVEIRLAVLDMAGTTVDEGGAVYVALAGAIGAALDRTVAEAEVRPWMGADKREAITGLLTALRAAPTAAEVDDAFADFSRRLDAAYLSTPPTPVAGVEAAMAAMRMNGVRVALTTGFPGRVADALLEALGWEVGRTIDAVVTAEQVGAGRPSPRMIERAMALTGVTDAAAVAVAGDTVRDLEAGANAGAAVVVGVLTGSQDAATLGAGPGTHLLPSVAELPTLLAALRTGDGPADPPR
jgi:phosphonatase-like hydrolase